MRYNGAILNKLHRFGATICQVTKIKLRDQRFNAFSNGIIPANIYCWNLFKQ